MNKVKAPPKPNPLPMTNEEWLRTLPVDERVKEVLSRGFMTEKRTAEEFVKWLEEKHDGYDITILSCPICNNPKLREYGNGIYQCDVCETYFDKDENIVLNEQEYLQTADTEQLAEFIVNLTLLDKYKLYDRMESAEYEHGIGVGAKKVIAEWLKQPHRGGS